MFHRLLPRLRLATARRPWLYWLGVAACAGVVWFGVAAAQAGLAEQRAQWGSTRRVWVTAEGVPAGEPVHVTARDYPAAMVPPDAVSAVPAHATAAHVLADGEVVVPGDLAGGDGDGLPAGWLVFAVPLGDAPRLVVGDRVTMFGSGRRWCDGTVRAIAAEHIDVAVPPECAADISAQLALSAVVLARAS